ncbi:MAG: hypothetical protein JNK30_00770 [Phenylobacterium sp.]|uniref:hypothetical protein n=1 Tax=Phenylobacterium sp. TaxID=1871053 RepID=UPI001A4F4F20|nr:hypothetical protein [Phenylobacterium sp.]MBL8769886.1 hypothetical protein [Phenylobacterium sp.]
MADGAGINPPTSATAPGGQEMFPGDFPEGLKPRLRLFFSADLVEATRYKQSRNVWRPEILNFYRDFDFILKAEHRAFADRHQPDLTAPTFWKSNGDELLYVCEMASPGEAHALMYVWLTALERYRATTADDAEHLDVKSTAWIALFPAPNAEIFFRRGDFGPLDQSARDPLVVQSEIRDEWYAYPFGSTITREFVGPSIDTGFRLTAWATPWRMALSVDLAFLLMGTSPGGIGQLRLNLSGCARLKGVACDQPYPHLWVPVGGRAAAEELRCEPYIDDQQVIRAFCEALIEQNYSSITPLFIEPGRTDSYDWVPPYILKRIRAHWRDEIEHRLAIEELARLGA